MSTKDISWELAFVARFRAEELLHEVLVALSMGEISVGEAEAWLTDYSPGSKPLVETVKQGSMAKPREPDKRQNTK